MKPDLTSCQRAFAISIVAGAINISLCRSAIPKLPLTIRPKQLTLPAVSVSESHACQRPCWRDLWAMPTGRHSSGALRQPSSAATPTEFFSQGGEQLSRLVLSLLQGLTEPKRTNPGRADVGICQVRSTGEGFLPRAGRTPRSNSSYSDSHAGQPRRCRARSRVSEANPC